MLGGYQILDLRGIDLTIGTSASNITDANVLKQLRELRNHIQKDYNFAKPLNNQLKPVLIRYRDKKNSEKHEVAIYGNLEVLTNYYTFKINAIGHDEKLSIEVVFEEKTDEYENKYWDIKTAKVLLSIDEAIGGDASIGGDLNVTGDTSIGGDLVVTGKVNGKIAFEDIEDAQGHKRFVEGDITIETIEGVTQTYGKWSLSGTHLMLVVACNVDTTANLRSVKLCDINLPDWIKDKIIVTFPNYSTVISATLTIKDVSSGDVIATPSIYLRKDNTNNVYINFANTTITITSNSLFRIEFDLLIDNDQPNP